MLTCVYIAAFVVTVTGGAVYGHATVHGFSSLQAFLALFEAVNLMIALWEIALFTYARKVSKEYRQLKEKWGSKGQLPQPMILFEDIPASKAFTLEYWASIWSTYALMDPAYQDCTSFGFWIDCGNGITTLIPTALTLVAMTWDIGLSPRFFGLVCFVVHYQEFYGTVLYFGQYVYNKKYTDQPTMNRLIVLFSNVFWMVAPGLAMYASAIIIHTGTLDIFRSPDVTQEDVEAASYAWTSTAAIALGPGAAVLVAAVILSS